MPEEHLTNNNKMVYRIPYILCVSMRFQKDGMTPGCSVSVLLLAVFHQKDDWQTLERLKERLCSIAYLCASFHRSGVNRLRARSPGCTAATKLVRTAFCNDSEASGPLANGRALNIASQRSMNFFFLWCGQNIYRAVYESRPKGGFERTPRTPPVYGPVWQVWSTSKSG